MPEPIEDLRLPLIKQIPPPSIASPSELRPRDPGDVRWYKPSASDTLALMGWRWIYFLPAIALLLLLVLLPRVVFLGPLIVGYAKILVIAVALPIGAFFKRARHSIRMRTEPFCIHCGYELTNLPDNYNCPECGEPYTHRVIEEYRRDPDWFIRRYKNRGAMPTADVPFEARKSLRKKSRDGT